MVVPDLQSGGWCFESRPGLLCTKVYSAFHPTRVGKRVPAAAWKAKEGMAHSNCGWTCGCAGKTVTSLENTCHTWALLRWRFTTKRRYIKCMQLYLLNLLYFTSASDWLERLVSEMTYNVVMGMLNLTHSFTHSKNVSIHKISAKASINVVNWRSNNPRSGSGLRVRSLPDIICVFVVSKTVRQDVHMVHAHILRFNGLGSPVAPLILLLQ